MADSTKIKLIPPFLSKCYDMVDDPATDPTISWGCTGASFVIWDVPTLEQQLLPKYYKHKNFSSFIRQLNVYGFKKNDPGRWEFTNQWFIKGQKQLLWNITRKKSTLGDNQQEQPQEINTSMRNKSSQDCRQNQLQKNNTSIKRKSSQGNRGRCQLQGNSTNTTKKSSQDNTQQNEAERNLTSTGACVEVGKFRLWEEVEILKKDKDIVMQEIAKLGNHQQGADGKLHRLGQRLQGMEISQQQMMSFLAMVVQNPGFLGQFLQQNEGSWVISEISKKRPYLALDQGAEYDELVASDGQMVTYQPLNETPKPLPTSSLNLNGHQQFDYSSSGLSNFFENLDLMQSEEGMAMQMEEDGHCDENQIVIPYLPEDGMLELEKLLLASPPPESVETSEPNSTGKVESCNDLDFTDYNISEEPSQTLSQLTKELGLLISKTNDEDGKMSIPCGYIKLVWKNDQTLNDAAITGDLKFEVWIHYTNLMLQTCMEE